MLTPCLYYECKELSTKLTLRINLGETHSESIKQKIEIYWHSVHSAVLSACLSYSLFLSLIYISIALLYVLPEKTWPLC